MAIDLNEASGKVTKEKTIFDDRLKSRIDELKWLYCDIFNDCLSVK